MYTLNIFVCVSILSSMHDSVSNETLALTLKILEAFYIVVWPLNLGGKLLGFLRNVSTSKFYIRSAHMYRL